MGLFTPKWMTDDRNKQIVALNAVNKVTNENVLKRIALEAPLPDVRVAAVYQMKDPALLREMAFFDDKYVSRAAINNITEPNVLKEIACENVTDAKLAVEKISNRKPLSRCNMLDGEKDFQHANKWKTEYNRLGIHIPWDRAKW